MRIVLDPTANAAYVEFQDIGDGEVAHTVPLDTFDEAEESLWGINLDFDADWHLLGVELENAGKLLTAAALEAAERSDSRSSHT